MLILLLSTDVFNSVSSSETPFGLVPIENSSIGDVKETMDAIRTTNLCVRGMTSLKIGHALLGSKEGKRKAEVKRVYSHEQVSSSSAEGSSVEELTCLSIPQGLGQCLGYLARLYPQAEIVPVNSTAKAAQEALEDEEALAICSIKCAEVYGLDVVDRNIQDGGAGKPVRLFERSLLMDPNSQHDSVRRPVGGFDTITKSISDSSRSTSSRRSTMKRCHLVKSTELRLRRGVLNVMASTKPTRPASSKCPSCASPGFPR